MRFICQLILPLILPVFLSWWEQPIRSTSPASHLGYFSVLTHRCHHTLFVARRERDSDGTVNQLKCRVALVGGLYRVSQVFLVWKERDRVGSRTAAIYTVQNAQKIIRSHTRKSRARTSSRVAHASGSSHGHPDFLQGGFLALAWTVRGAGSP